MKLLIDGDLLLYTCGFAIEGKYYTTPDDKVHHKYKDALKHCEVNNLDPDWIMCIGRSIEPISHGIKLIKNIMERCDEAFPESHKHVYVSAKDSPNYRREIATELEYKGNRTYEKPYHFDGMREYLINKYHATEVYGIEVDDALGIAQDKTGENSTVICSLDKDMLMIPGLHYNWRKNVTVEITPLEGYRNFYKQVLTGDRTDNIKGISGIGPAKADKLLKNATSPEEMFAIVQKVYQEAGISMSKLSERGKLLWIQQEPDVIWSMSAISENNGL